MRRSFAVVSLLFLMSSVATAESVANLSGEQKAVEKQKEKLRQEVRRIEKEIDSKEAGEKDVLAHLRDSEQSISKINAKLYELNARESKAEKELAQLSQTSQKQKEGLEQSRQELSQQLYAQYTNGLSPWSALLSGQDAQQMGRDLGYLSYVSKARADAVQRYRKKIAELKETEKKINKSKQEIATLQEETQSSKDKLQKVQKRYQANLEDIRDDLKKRRAKADTLNKDQRRLDGLLSGIANKIASQKAAIREAEIARQKQALAKERELAQQRQKQQKIAQEQAKIAQERKARADALQKQADKMRQQAMQAHKQDQQELAQAQNQLGLAISPEQEEVAKQRIQEVLNQQKETQNQWKSAIKQSEEAEIEQAKARIAREKQEQAARLEKKAREDAQKAKSKANSDGLHAGAPWPLRGEIRGRFGTTRPDTGSVWRGILIQASHGASVKSVAAGTVVYANWIKGFGNLMIVDHENGYMSVYGYNDSLLKGVGDRVSTGQVIARAGASGGQVEPALYFEIRKGSKPVDPLSLLAK